MFRTNNLKYLVILDTTTFTVGTWLDNQNMPNIRSSASPNAASQSKIYFRDATVRDPLVAVSTDINADTIYYGESKTGYTTLFSEAEGFSVWLRQSPATEVEFCLSALSSVCMSPLRTSTEQIVIGFSQNTQQEISQDSELQKQLLGCSYSSCLLYE